MRLATLAEIFVAREWPEYLGVAAASMLGVAIGSAWRERVDTETILRMLYALLFLTAATMFGAIENLEAGLACLAGAVVWTAVTLLAYYYPERARAPFIWATRELRYMCCCARCRRG